MCMCVCMCVCVCVCLCRGIVDKCRRQRVWWIRLSNNVNVACVPAPADAKGREVFWANHERNVSWNRPCCSLRCDVNVDQSQSRVSGVLMHDFVGIIRPVLELFMVRYVQAFEAVNLCLIHSWRVPWHSPRILKGGKGARANTAAGVCSLLYQQRKRQIKPAVQTIYKSQPPSTCLKTMRLILSKKTNALKY